MNKDEEITKDEIRKEFQLDRMVLFSDAVFAIVITLMAIEIRLPHFDGELTHEILVSQIMHLIPVILAYAGSFLFIGNSWYHHLQTFSLLKDYDRGLVVRNLIMLFFIGFFPFSASLVADAKGLYLPIAIYFAVVLACSLCQMRLQYYILVKHPELRIQTDISDQLLRFKTSRIVTILLATIFVLATTTYYLVEDPRFRFVAWWWFIPFPLVLKYFKKKLLKPAK